MTSVVSAINTGFEWAAKGCNVVVRSQVPWILSEGILAYLFTSLEEGEFVEYEKIPPADRDLTTKVLPQSWDPYGFLVIYAALVTVVATHGLRKLPSLSFLAQLPLSVGLKYVDIIALTRLWPACENDECPATPEAHYLTIKEIKQDEAYKTPEFGLLCGYILLRSGGMLLQGFATNRGVSLGSIFQQMRNLTGRILNR